MEVAEYLIEAKNPFNIMASNDLATLRTSNHRPW